jgi:hypothetical protein
MQQNWILISRWDSVLPKAGVCFLEGKAQSASSNHFLQKMKRLLM